MARADNPSGDAVGRALRSWTSQLIDTGGRNRLLYFKPLKRGTLELGLESGADLRVVGALQRGHTIKLSACFPEDDGAEASQRARWIQRKAREHEEEQGIRTLYLGWRLATWEQSGPGPATPNAPLLLAAAELVPQGRMGDDFALSVADDWEVNPSMAQLLKREFGAELDEAALQDLLQAEPIDDAEIVKQLRRAYVEVPGFDIADGLVLGTFSYAKLPMVRDLEAAEEAVAQHPLVAAIAGDPLAQRQLRDSQQDATQADGASGGDDLAPQDEFLVLDADGTQSEVINAAVGGANLVVVGPPGTGKSQTIANLLATLTARGRSTLFVAEKRAAIDAVVKRLQGVGLGDLVLDLHEGMRSRRQTAEQLANALQAAHTAHAPDVKRLQRTLTRRRDTLNEAQLALHQPREPWGLSIYQLQSRILAMSEADDLGLRAHGQALNALHGTDLEDAKETLVEYVNLGGANLDASHDAPWSAAHRASVLSARDRVNEAATAVDDLSGRLLPTLEDELTELARQLGIEPPGTAETTRALVDALAQFQPLSGRLTPASFDADDLDDLVAVLAPAEQGPLARIRGNESTPWGVTVNELEARIQNLEAAPDSSFRLSGDALRALGGDALPQVMADLAEYVDRGGADLDASASAWSAAHQAGTIESGERADTAAALLEALSSKLLPDAEQRLRQTARQLDLTAPATIDDSRATLGLIRDLQKHREWFTPAVFDEDIDSLVDELDPSQRGVLGRLQARLFDTRYRAAVQRSRELLRQSDISPQEVRSRLVAFSEMCQTWQDSVGVGPTETAWNVDIEECEAALSQFADALTELDKIAALNGIGLDWAAQREHLAALERERTVLFQLPHLHTLRDRLHSASIAALAAEAKQREWNGSDAAQALDDAWTRSVLDEIAQEEPMWRAPYRAARERINELLIHPDVPTTWARRWLREFLVARHLWRQATEAPPTVAVWTVSPDGCAAALEQLVGALNAFRPLAALGDAELDWAGERERLASLQRERTVLFQLPRLHELRDQLKRRGLARLAAAIHERGLSGDDTARVFEEAWTRSVLDAVKTQESALATFDAAGHDAAVAEFCEADRRHIEQSPPRVVRAWAEAAVAARDAHPEQSQLIMREANRKRRHLPTRELFQQAPDVLTALKPCWVMSPLVVAQLLPLNGEPPFDVVVFDEASQIPPADAVSSLLRGRQAIVAGDPKQLPPTSFFTSSSEDEDEENDQDTPLTQDVESILDAMSTLLPMPWGSRTLGWHYRSKDERLIAFSNHHIYDRRLTTFPGALPDDCMAHVEVPFEEDAAWVSGSYSPEVERVVRLILEHAEQRSDETLGVIALGATHANRIAETLRLARRDRPDLDEFFSEANAEPFFVKNLERVQGDERDAIILTVGYGRTADGRMRYNFGPINQEGGFRRLNVAVTRAKRRMTVVSCFSDDDMDPDRLTNQGVRMLRDYIEYAAGGGRTLGSGAVDAPPLNAFEIDIKKRLEKRGLDLQPQYGVSGYRIDFAVMHPNEPGRPILAIEADGAQYHSAQATRDRDRLRQENLERLGWRFHRIWSTEWFRNPELEAERAVAAYRQALAADRGGSPPPAAAPTPPPAAPEPAPQRRPRPNVRAGQKIDEYSEQQLIRVVEWIKSDGRLRTEDELLAEAMRELGFKRRGTKIVAALQAAIRADG